MQFAISISLRCDHSHGSNRPYHILNRVPNRIPTKEPVPRGVVWAWVLQSLRIIDLHTPQEVLGLVRVNNIAAHSKARLNAVLILPDEV
jgi:hypothetical protein